MVPISIQSIPLKFHEFFFIFPKTSYLANILSNSIIWLHHYLHFFIIIYIIELIWWVVKSFLSHSFIFLMIINYFCQTINKPLFFMHPQLTFETLKTYRSSIYYRSMIGSNLNIDFILPIYRFFSNILCHLMYPTILKLWMGFI